MPQTNRLPQDGQTFSHTTGSSGSTIAIPLEFSAKAPIFKVR